MRADWEQTTLGDVVSFKGGGTPSTEKAAYWNGDIPWVSPKDMKSSSVGDSVDKITPEAIENSAASLIPKDAILIVVRSGILARTIPVGVTTRPLAVNQDIKALCPKRGVDPHYLHYFMQMSEPDILKLVTRGATVHRLSTDSLKALKLAKPPLAEQQRIVAILDEAFAGLATATANAEKNLKNARELFESYLNSVFAQKGKGWVCRQIGDVATTQYGLSGTLNSNGEGYKIFRMGEVQDGRLIDTGRMKFIEIGNGEFEQYRLRRGDVLFNRTNSSDLVGKTGLFDLEGDYCFASYLVRVNFDPSKMNSKFAAYLMNTSVFLMRIRAKAARSVNQANINATILRNEAIDFPEDANVQANFAADFDALSLETKRLEESYKNKSAQLVDLKQSILRKAFSGELTSPPSQAIKEAAE